MVQAVVQTTVVALQGNPVSATAPTANQSLTWSGSAWAPAGPFLSAAGGALTGPLTLSGNASAALGAVPLQQLQSTVAGYLPLAGGTMSGAIQWTQGGSSTTISNNAINCGGTLSIVGTGSGYFLAIDGNNNRFLSFANSWNWIWFALNGNMQWSTQPAGTVFTIGSTGNLTIAGTLSQGSDQTNKTNINALTQGISLIRQLIPKSFAFNSSPNTAQWGFIAQDVEGVIPAAVSSSQGGTIAAPTTTLALDVTGILAAVTMAVKQLDERCTALESHDGITPPAAQLA